MPKTAKQNQQIREVTQAKLVESGLLMFAEYGYASTSIRKIAAHANVSMGLLYRYFESKEALLIAVCEQSIGAISSRFLEEIARCDEKEIAHVLVHTIFDMLQAEEHHWRLFYNLRAQPSIMAILGDRFRQWTKLLRERFITHFQDVGRAEPELDAYLLYSLIEGAIQQFQLDPENYPLDAVAKRIVVDYL